MHVHERDVVDDLEKHPSYRKRHGADRKTGERCEHDQAHADHEPARGSRLWGRVRVVITAGQIPAFLNAAMIASRSCGVRGPQRDAIESSRPITRPLRHRRESATTPRGPRRSMRLVRSRSCRPRR